MSTTLAISHYLHLTKEERYAWHQGNLLEVIGVSIPVWYYKGVSSEPAVEVFCKYRLIPSLEGIHIKHFTSGYEVIVPRNPPKEFMPLPDEEWKEMSKEQQEEWYENNEPNPSIKMLLDIKDGGSKYLAFKQHSKVRKDKKILNVVHYMEIKDMDDLMQTLT